MWAFRVLTVPALLFPLVACVGAPPAVQTYPAEASRTVFVDGVAVHYLDFNPSGAGPVLIWVHGQAGVSMETLYLARELPADYRLIAIDLPGNGFSEKPRREYTEEYYQDVLRRFIAYVDVDEYVLVAHSLGGVSVLPVAAEQPPGLRALVLVAPYYFAGQAGGLLELLTNTGPLVDFAMFVYAPWMMRLVVRGNVFYDSSLVPEDLFNSYRRAVFHTDNGRGALASVTRNMVGRQREADTLSRISVPTLIVWGSEDRVLSYQYAQRFMDAIPGSTLITYEQCSHVPHVERVSDFAGDLDSFLRSMDSDG